MTVPLNVRQTSGKLEAYHIPIVLSVAFVVRLALIVSTSTPILAWRPTELASIALNYYRNGFNFLYPQVYWGGGGPGYVEMEFPLIPFLTACMYKVLGLHEWVALIIPVLTGLGTALVAYLFTRYLFGVSAALVAGLVVGGSPTMALLTASLWPDPPMVMAGALGLYALTRWADSGESRYYILGAAATSVAILLKIVALYLGVPILFLCFHRYKSALWKTPQVWLLSALILGPPLLWYWHAHTLFVLYHNTFGILSSGSMKFGTAAVLTDPAFYASTLLKIALFHLTPLAFIVFLWGLLNRPQQKLAYVVHAWLAGVALCLLVAAKGVTLGHYQYVLPVVPAAAPLVGAGAVDLLRRLASRVSWIRPSSGILIIAGALALVYIAGCVTGIALYRSKAWYMWENDRRTGIAVARVAPPGSLILVVDNDQDEFPPEKSMTPPMVFYFSDRKGWYQSMAWLTQDRLEELRGHGARYLVITSNAAASFKSTFAAMRSYVSSRFAAVLDNQDGIVYDLQPAAPAPAE
jgi:4-amino-4-deoxy-L-arabinose transferase-like glycosyltransferase